MHERSNHSRRGTLATLLGIGATLGLPLALRAQPSGDWPNRPVRLIVGYGAGGTLDQAMRLIAQHASVAMGQTVVVDNRAGASGTIGAAAVVQAPADGYTFLAGGDPELVLAAQIGKPPYDPEADLVPLSITALAPFVFALHAQRPEGSLADLLATARREPISCAIAGARSSMELGLEMLNRRLGTRFVPVPYRGGGSLAVDVASGQLPLALTGPLSVEAMAKEGRIRVLGVFQRERTPLLPDVTAIGELGFREIEVIALHVISARSDVPSAIRARFSDLVRAAAASPEVAARLRAAGVNPVALAPAESLKRLRDTAASYRVAVSELGWDKAKS